MADKYQNKYRIASSRLKNWDYSSNGAYFVTICTKNRRHFFGEIINGNMQLSDLGKIAHKYWMEIPLRFIFVKLGVMVIMPNHMHGIVIINNKNDVCRRDAIYRVSLDDDGNEIREIRKIIGDAINRVCTDDIPNPILDDISNNIPDDIQNPIPDNISNNILNNISNNIPSNNPSGGVTGINNPMHTGSLSEIIRWYKGRVSFESRKVHLKFSWQPRFHDHVIRNNKSYVRIQEYIINNPSSWFKDKFSE